jgi:hypothetical protein
VNTWTAADLGVVEDTAEIHIASRRGDGTLRPARIVWVVRHDDALYVRSVNGPGAAWSAASRPDTKAGSAPADYSGT